MSAMLIAPAAAARQYTQKMYGMLVLAACFGLVSGFFGNYLSVELARTPSLSQERLVWPTGPMVVVVASAICLLSLMFAPERGLLLRLMRIARFRYRCMCENLLKSMWRQGPETVVSFADIAQFQNASPLYLRFILWRLQAQGWIVKVGRGLFRLTIEGKEWAARIVRLHRLWEVYLAHYLGVGGERVHRNAEEMEHIITPQIESQLILLLKDPKQDPHHQPIPQKQQVPHESL
jgi:manganese/zinc/iron transport system permease protein